MRKRDVSAKTTFVQSINKGKRLRGEEKVFKKIYIYKNPRILAMIKMKGGWKKDVQVFFTLNIVKKTAWQNYSNYTYSHHTAKRGGQGPLFQHLHSKPVKTSVSHFFSTSSQMNCAGKSNFLFEKKLDVLQFFHDLVGVLLWKQITGTLLALSFPFCWRGVGGALGAWLGFLFSVTEAPPKKINDAKLFAKTVLGHWDFNFLPLHDLYN